MSGSADASVDAGDEPAGERPAGDYRGRSWYRDLVADTMACVDDVQRLVLVGNGSGTFPAVRYVLATVERPEAARAWLAGLADRGAGDAFRLSRASDAVAGPDLPRTDAEKGPARLALALTAAGLRALGVPAAELSTFPAEFREGPHARGELLGDTDANGPGNWVAPLRAEDAADLHVVVGLWELPREQGRLDVGGELASGGLRVLGELRGHLLEDNREPFGFKDGIGQPVVPGLAWCSDTRKLGQRPSPDRLVAVGEFVLGRRGELGDVSRWRVPGLAPHEQDRLGYHGSFAALRLMRQDVDAFHAWMDRRRAQGDDAERAAARLVGRTRDGAPLRPPGVPTDDENFDYGDDLDGVACPVGSHTRRAHPRAGRIVSRGRHQRRLIRRGSPYETAGPAVGDPPESGLIGIFVCANLAAQYEGVLGEWVHHGLHHPDLTGISDPLIGSRGVDTAGADTAGARGDEAGGGAGDEVGGLAQFVYTRGVAYLFLPGVAALRRLAGVRA